MYQNYISYFIVVQFISAEERNVYYHFCMFVC